ncbi:Hydroxymethylglutaryl-CoA lyase [Hibiscus syriacus]|uniref:hydroxymethylglutaryl-CoA lyase n=1 Tax=Hibiscus syriacus TaxID=106335 RepID=A0A6A2X9K8_HIBSY|nr:Hydroxymethylglutaryl-CoA lyase [Hibiscus syriacus]
MIATRRVEKISRLMESRAPMLLKSIGNYSPKNKQSIYLFFIVCTIYYTPGLKKSSGICEESGGWDGLQNEKEIVPTTVKVECCRGHEFCLAKIGSTDAKDVMDAIRNIQGARSPVLTPNLKSNINFSIEDSLARYRDVASAARELSLPVRGRKGCSFFLYPPFGIGYRIRYISCVVGCPVDGMVPPSKVAYVAKQLFHMGCSEIPLGDTIGVGTPGTVIPMLENVMNVVPIDKLAVHFHDTYGQALSNILTSLQMGISTVDSSVSGLGGCPYAKGASGNVATEDVVYMLNGHWIKTNVDLKKLLLAGDFICKHLNRQPSSKMAVALSSKKANSEL